MFKIMIGLLLTISLHANLLEDWNTLTEHEKDTIVMAYHRGKVNDIGLTLGAICWQESVGGRYLISTDKNDYGFYHVNIHWYLKELHIKENMWSISKYSSILMTRPDIEEAYVVAKIKYLRKVYRDNWHKIWWHYNGSELYAYHIAEKVKFLSYITKTRKVNAVYMD